MFRREHQRLGRLLHHFASLFFDSILEGAIEFLVALLKLLILLLHLITLFHRFSQVLLVLFDLAPSKLYIALGSLQLLPQSCQFPAQMKILLAQMSYLRARNSRGRRRAIDTWKNVRITRSLVFQQFTPAGRSRGPHNRAGRIVAHLIW